MKRGILAGAFVLAVATAAHAQPFPSLSDALEVTPTPAQYYGGGYDRDQRWRERRNPPNTGYQPEDSRLQRGSGQRYQPEDSRLTPQRRDYNQGYDRGYDRGSRGGYGNGIPPVGQGRYTYCQDGRCSDGTTLR